MEDHFRGLFSTETLPTPPPIRMTAVNEDAKVTEFQQEMIHLASVITGDHLLPNFVNNIKHMIVRDAKAYTDGAMRTFMEAATRARNIGLDDEKGLEFWPSVAS